MLARTCYRFQSDAEKGAKCQSGGQGGPPECRGEVQRQGARARRIGPMTASQIQGYARRPVRAVDATPDRHHNGTTGDRSNRGGEEAGRSHSTTAPNSALCMPRVLDVEVIHEASRTNDSDTPSAVRQVRAYAVVTAVGNQRPASVDSMSSMKQSPRRPTR
jgi:hypothetical protein